MEGSCSWSAGDVHAHEENFTKLSYPPEDPMRSDPGSAFAGLMQTLRPDVVGMQEVGSRDIGRLRAGLHSHGISKAVRRGDGEVLVPGQ